MTDHAGANRFPWVADLPEELAVRWLGKSPQDLIAHAGRVFGHVPELDSELLLGIVLVKLLLQP